MIPCSEAKIITCYLPLIDPLIFGSQRRIYSLYDQVFRVIIMRFRPYVIL
jgi:hypothetical protein